MNFNREHPLTDNQARLWIEWKLNPASPSYNIGVAFRVVGSLDLNVLQRALSTLVNRFDSFRTYFVENADKVKQIVLPVNSYKHELLNILHLGKEHKQSPQDIINDELRKPFDLKKAPLFRFTLVKDGDNKSYFIAVVHHILIDGFSMVRFLNDLSGLYNNYTKSEHQVKQGVQDYFLHLQEHRTKQAYKDDVSYWKKKLKDIDTHFDFQLPPNGLARESGRRLYFRLNKKLTHAIRNLAKDTNSTVFIVLMAAFKTLIYRYFGAEQITVGYAVNIRPKGLSDLFGFYVNNIFLTSNINGNISFMKLIREISQTRLGDRKHQSLSLLEIAKLSKNQDIVPNITLNQTSFPIISASHKENGLHLEGLEITPIPTDIGEIHGDLNFLYDDIGENIVFTIEYKESIFTSDFIKGLKTHFTKILQDVAENPSKNIADIAMLTEAEQTRLLYEYNNTEFNYPTDKTIKELFGQIAVQNKQRIAVEDNEQKLTYGTLNKLSNQTAHYLQDKGIKSGDIIAVCMNRSVKLVTTILGIIKAGATYLPIDPDYPNSRIEFILNDSHARLLIVADRQQISAFQSSTKLLVMDEDSADIITKSTDNLQDHTNVDRVFYVIYTSGSTGKPKGVPIFERSLLNLIFWHQDTYKITSKDRSSMVAGEGFDASVWEMWPYLTAGATIHIADKNTVLDTHTLQNWLEDKKITISFLPTPIAEILLQQEGIKNLSKLKFLLTGGDQLKHYPRAGLPFILYNHYGPTENTVVATYTIVPPQRKVTFPDFPPIGKPIYNNRAYVLDQGGNLLPEGLIGELHIAGISLTQGYINNSELNKKKFVANPFEEHTKMYKTGDLVYRSKQGDLYYVGRIDKQVKIRGFRIELSEVEKQLLLNEKIEQCVATVKTDEHANKAIIAYYVLHNSKTDITELDLIDELKKHLPGYMIPQALVKMESLPLTQNGKVDTESLPLPNEINRGSSKQIVLPHTKVEHELTDILAKVLNTKDFGIYDDFFELGGHSLLISTVLLEVKNKFDQDVSFGEFFRNPTIYSLAQLLEKEDSAQIKTEQKKAYQHLTSIRLPEEIQAISSRSNINNDNPKVVLLTGATGFIGTHLLTDLYALTQVKIVCLVRAEDIFKAKARLKTAILKYGLDISMLDNGRIVPVIGDLTRPRLGISEGDFSDLAQQIDTIYHCGAHVHHIYNYETLKDANVSSTLEILKLATTAKAKHIVYISALTAAVDRDNNGFITEDFLVESSDPSHLIFGYAQTKWASERLLAQANDRGISCDIYRLAIVSGHSKTGYCSFEKDHFLSVVKGCMQLKCAPAWDIELSMTPVDFVSRFVVSSSISNKSNRVFNIINPNMINWLDFIPWLNNMFYCDVMLVPPEKWCRELKKINNKNTLFTLLPIYLNIYKQEKRCIPIGIPDIHYRNTEEIRGIIGMEHYKLEEFLKIYFNFLRKNLFAEIERTEVCIT